MAESTIAIKLNGVDNASKTIAAVKGQLDGLNKKVVSTGTIANKATSVASAGMQAFSGSLTGAISGARGMAAAIQGMGIAMNTAMPIAAALAAVIASIGYAVRKANEESEKSARHIERETKAILDQVKAREEDAKARESQLNHEKRMLDLRNKIDNASPVQRNRRESDLAVKEYLNTISNEDDLRRSIAQLKAEISDKDKIANGTFDSVFGTHHIYDREERRKARKALEDLTKELADKEKELAGLTPLIEEQKASLKLLNVERERLIEAEKQAQQEEKYQKAKTAAEQWLREEEAIEEFYSARSRLVKRMEEEIKSFGESLLARDVSATASGSRQVSREEMNRIAALQASGIFKATATGYSTSQGDASRAEYRAQKQMQFQDEVVQLLRSMEKKAGVEEGGLNVSIMDF